MNKQTIKYVLVIAGGIIAAAVLGPMIKQLLAKFGVATTA